MICRQCETVMVLKSTKHGKYTLCNPCSKVDFSSYSEYELDMIADRGRD